MITIKTTPSSTSPRASFESIGSILVSAVFLFLAVTPVFATGEVDTSDCPPRIDYSAIWSQRDPYVDAVPASSLAQFQAAEADLAGKQLFDLEVEYRDGSRLYTGLFRDFTGATTDPYQIVEGAAPPLPPALDPAGGGVGGWDDGTGGGSGTGGGTGTGCDPATGSSCGGSCDVTTGSGCGTTTGTQTTDFLAEVATWRTLGYELVDFEIGTWRNEIFGVFHPGAPTHELELDIAFSDAQQRVADQLALDWVPVDVETYLIGGVDYMAILWQHQPQGDYQLVWGEQYQDFAATAQLLWETGYRPIDMEQFFTFGQLASDPANGYMNYIGIWEKSRSLDYYLGKGSWQTVIDIDTQLTLDALDEVPPIQPPQLLDLDFAPRGPGCGNNPQPLDHSAPTGDDPLDDEHQEEETTNNGGS